VSTATHLTRIGDIARLVDRPTSAENLPVYSISKHRGFVRSDEYFNKKVHSEDTSSYRSVAPGDFAFSPIHLDEGSIALAEQAGLISPMYRVFEVDAEACDRSYIIRILKSPPMVARYNTLGD
jgi:type I restriction enzyme, S subunit